MLTREAEAKRAEAAAARVAQPPASDGEVFEVEMIVGDRIWRGKRQFLLKWKNYTSSDNTWEDEDDLQCEDLLAAYLARKGAEAAAKTAPKSPKPKQKPAEEKPPKERPPARRPNEKPREGDGDDTEADPKPDSSSQRTRQCPRQVSDEDASKRILFHFPDVAIPTGIPKVEILGSRRQADVWYYSLKVDGAKPIEEPSDVVRIVYPTELASFLLNVITEQTDD